MLVLHVGLRLLKGGYPFAGILVTGSGGYHQPFKAFGYILFRTIADCQRRSILFCAHTWLNSAACLYRFNALAGAFLTPKPPLYIRAIFFASAAPA